MDCICLNLDQIVDITSKELIYCDNRGEQNHIDLPQCRDRYLEYINSHLAEYPVRKGMPIKDDDEFRCVADRFYSGIGNSFYEFYECPRVRFELRIPDNFLRKILPFVNWRNQREKYKKFYSMQMRIEKAGWRTYDLS